MSARAWPSWAKGVAVAAVYAVVAHASKTLNLADGAAAPVWPPAGLGFAALVIAGPRLWPAVFAGVLLSDLGLHVPLGSVVGEAIASSLNALVGASLLARWGFGKAFDRLRDVPRFAVAALAGSFVSGLVGSASVVLGRGLPLAGFHEIGFVWWLGDLMGNLTLAPAILTLAAREPGAGHGLRARAPEALALAAVCVLAGIAFFTPIGGEVRWLPVTYLLLPLVLWAAFRFGPAGASLSVVVISAFATFGTLRGDGPFASGETLERLALVQIFIAVHVLVGLSVAATNRERQAAIRLRDDFLSIASHELKTPLTPLKVSLDLLRRRGDPVATLRNLERANRQLDRLIGLVDDLLDVSRIGAGRLALVPGPVDLMEVAREVSLRFAALADSSRCAVEVRGEASLVGRWDRTRIEQVLTNLLTNAFKYAAGAPVVVSVERAGERARLVVRDFGPGVPPADRERVFERWERAGARSGAVPGLGLGLYISRQIVEAHGGSMRLTDAAPGSAFVVELPLAPGVLAPAPDPKEAVTDPGHPPA